MRALGTCASPAEPPPEVLRVRQIQGRVMRVWVGDRRCRDCVGERVTSGLVGPATLGLAEAGSAARAWPRRALDRMCTVLPASTRLPFHSA